MRIYSNETLKFLLLFFKLDYNMYVNLYIKVFASSVALQSDYGASLFSQSSIILSFNDPGTCGGLHVSLLS